MITGEVSPICSGNPVLSLLKILTDDIGFCLATTLTPSERTSPPPILPDLSGFSCMTGRKYPDIWPGQNAVTLADSMIKGAW